MAKNSTIIKARYDATHTKPYYFKLHLEYDSDIINKLDNVESRQGYIKQLIRDDIARTCSVPNQYGLPTHTENGWYKCSNCNKSIAMMQTDGSPHIEYKYCPWCGHKIKWVYEPDPHIKTNK